MDGVSAAASIVGIATAGIQISIKLVTLASQISTASDRVTSIGNDVSLTSGILHQLGELMSQKASDTGISIFSQGGLETTRSSAAMCERVFQEVEKEIGKASKQIAGSKKLEEGKIKLSRLERAKWPFLQPGIDVLRADLREAKGTLMLMLQVASLALSKKMADHAVIPSTTNEEDSIVRAILAIQQQQNPQSRPDLGLGKPRSPPEAGNPSSRMPIVRNDSSTSLVPPKPSVQTNAAVNEASHGRPPITGNNNHNGPSPQQASGQSLTSPSRDNEGSQASRVPPNASPSETTSTQNSRSALAETHRIKLHMYLLKPKVADYGGTVELTWDVRDIKMPKNEIWDQWAKSKQGNLPSLLDLLETLHSDELDAINHLTRRHESSNPGSTFELMTLKRNVTNISHRGMVFQNVPQLRFIIEQRVALPSLPQDNIRSPTPPWQQQHPPISSRSHRSAVRGHDYYYDDDSEDLRDIRQRRVGYQGGFSPTSSWHGSGSHSPDTYETEFPLVEDHGIERERIFKEAKAATKNNEDGESDREKYGEEGMKRHNKEAVKTEAKEVKPTDEEEASEEYEEERLVKEAKEAKMRSEEEELMRKRYEERTIAELLEKYTTLYE